MTPPKLLISAFRVQRNRTRKTDFLPLFDFADGQTPPLFQNHSKIDYSSTMKEGRCSKLFLNKIR